MPPRPHRVDWAGMRARQAGARKGAADGLLYEEGFVTPADRAAIVSWLATLQPLWEDRFSPHHPPPPGQSQRRLLRPVYWLGNWQFACLGYYHPPKGVLHRCVRAEPFPPVLAKLVAVIEKKLRARLSPADVPKGWTLNTCLVNFYGDHVVDGKRTDTARVGEHKDFEPGPVASLSFGDRALFQFVASRSPGQRDAVVSQQWLEDSALQAFAGPKWKDRLFHRVQRVERKGGPVFPIRVDDFETRRVNFTFRYVPDAHVVRYAQLPNDDAADVRGYMETLAQSSPFFARALAERG